MRPRARSDGRSAHHLDAREPRRPRERAERFDRRHVPVAEVGVELAAGVELEQAPALVAGNLRGDGLDHRDPRVTARSRSRHVSGSFMWYSTPRYSTMSNVPNVARSTVVKSATTGSTRLVEHAVREIEAARPGKIRAPEVGRVARLVGQLAAFEALVPVLRARGEVDAPRVVIERDDRATRRGARRGTSSSRPTRRYPAPSGPGSREAGPRSPSRPSPTGPW